ncbi:MAG: bifunctional lysylphosphatidylglycerol flippase/synthetase MprF [Rhodobacteraceae bacterium]|jgi:phosphatidylglycerol lysyltransferase|nr:bifunctional lysylphosphatidylglycerol flippase/synthetase MprF [Paracoccaceae bacterium]
MIAAVAHRAARLLRLADAPLARGLMPLVIGAVALAALHAMSRTVHPADVRAALAAVPPGRLGLALGGVALSYAALAMYDVLAVRRLVPGKVRLPVAAAAGAAGYAVSNLLGLSYLTGTAVRHRIYGSAGLDLGHVIGIVATSWSAFWMAAVLLLGGLMLLHPAGLAAELPIGPGTERAAGVVLLAALAGFLGWLAAWPRGVTVGGRRHPLPGLAGALALMAAGVLDIAGAALVLWAVLPPDVTGNAAVFLAAFLGAVTLGILSHSPGGLGVFEAAMVAGLGAAGRPDVLAALLLYRLLYGVLPFAVAATGLGVLTLLQERRQLSAGSALLARSLAPLVPVVAAGVALVSGVMLLLSGSLPIDPQGLAALRGARPLLAVVELSHLAGSVAGLLLVIVARGLGRRLARAWAVAMVLLAVGLAASLAAGPAWPQGIGLAAALAVLGLFRRAFHRRADGGLFRLDAGWLATVAALLASAVWLGFLAYRHVDYGDALWWRFAWDGDASRFLRATLVMAVIVLAVAFNSLISARGPRVRAGTVPQAVPGLLARSPRADAQIALSGDKLFLLDPAGRACLAYADTGHTLVALGDPVGDDRDAARALIWSLRELADRTGRRCAFYRVGSDFLPTYLDLGLSVLKTGEVARVPLPGFTLEGSNRRDLRQAVNKARREGYVFEVIPRAGVPARFAALKAVSDAWLAARQGAEKGFSLGACTPDYLARFDIAVLRGGPSDKIVAFANVMRGADRTELSLDLMRHGDDCPRYGMDALFGFLMLMGRDEGYRWFSLGGAPLSGLENRRLASRWNRIGGFIHDHGERFYHFEGLRAFKQKFDPEWTPEYLACPGGLAVPRVLFEVSTLISRGVRGLVA